MVLERMTEHDFPDLVIAVDWSVKAKKRWMVRAELGFREVYVVFTPEPVGDVKTLIARIQDSIPPAGTALIGFDFPIGLPYKYAEKVGIINWRKSLTHLLQLKKNSYVKSGYYTH